MEQRHGDLLPASPSATMVAVLAVVLAADLLLAVTCLNGQHYGSDFVEFWAASRLGLAGHAADIYNPTIIFQMEKAAVPTLQNVTPCFYPPMAYLTILPWGLLPYKAAYWIFELLTLGIFLTMFRCITRNRTALWCVLAFPGLWINFLYGQNGFLTAALAAAALLCLRRRPVLAGVLTGLLVIKPHLALLFPVALIAIGAWRAIASAAVTALAFVAVSARVMGAAAVKQGFDSVSHFRALLEAGVCQESMPTVFSLLHLLGASVRTAYCVHALVALAATAVVWKVWRACDDWALRSATLMTATLMVSPYLQVYDLTWLAFPILWLALAATRNGWLRAERTALIAPWLLPLLMAELAFALRLQIGPLVVGALACVAVRRAKSAG